MSIAENQIIESISANAWVVDGGGVLAMGPFGTSRRMPWDRSHLPTVSQNRNPKSPMAVAQTGYTDPAARRLTRWRMSLTARRTSPTRNNSAAPTYNPTVRTPPTMSAINDAMW